MRSYLSSFPRSVVTSIFTTSLDFALLTTLVELAHVNYVLATFLGTVLGATSNFLINRQWAFRGHDGRAGGQAGRYFMVQVGSSGLHTLGVWLLTAFGGVRYLVAKLVVATLAYLVWNYPMNHYFVFPARRSRSRKRSRIAACRCDRGVRRVRALRDLRRSAGRADFRSGDLDRRLRTWIA